MEITIDTHDSTKEEIKELIDYLEENFWDFQPNSLKYDLEGV